MARSFVTLDKVTLALGGGASIAGAGSFAAILQKTTDGIIQNVVCIGNVAATERGLFFGTANNMIFRSAGATTATGSTPTVAADGWVLVAGTKAAGVATPRFHRYKFSTGTWVHEAGTATVGDSTPSGISFIAARGSAGTGSFNGNIAAVGAWTTALTDAQVETLAYSFVPWFSYSPNGLWILDQAATSTKVWDITGKGANETALTGTTVATTAVPVWNRGHRILPVSFSVPAVIPPTPPAPTQQPGGKSLGRRGPWYPDRTPEQVLRDEEELMVIL